MTTTAVTIPRERPPGLRPENAPRHRPALRKRLAVAAKHRLDLVGLRALHSSRGSQANREAVMTGGGGFQDAKVPFRSAWCRHDRSGRIADGDANDGGARASPSMKTCRRPASPAMDSRPSAGSRLARRSSSRCTLP